MEHSTCEEATSLSDAELLSLLTIENRRLREVLQASRVSEAYPPNLDKCDRASELGEESSSPARPPSYTELLAQYNDLKQRHSKCEAKLEHYRAKIARHRQVVKEWHDYVAQKESGRERPDAVHLRLPALERPQGTESGEHEANLAPRETLLDQNNEPVLSFEPLRHERASSLPGKATGLRPENDTTASMAPQSASSQSPNVTSSQSTSIENVTQGDDQLVVKDEPLSGDEPIVVFARPTKRKRDEDRDRTSRKSRIKEEPVDSQDVLAARLGATVASPNLSPILFRTTTSDLDLIGTPMQTPRKHRYDLERHERTNSEVSTQDGACSISMQPRALRTNRIVGEPHLKPDSDQPADTTKCDAARSSGILRPISANLPRSSKKASLQQKEKHRIRRTGLGDRISDLAEDRCATRREDGQEDKTRTPQRERLGRMLEGQMDSRQRVQARRATSPASTPKKSEQVNKQDRSDGSIKRTSAVHKSASGDGEASPDPTTTSTSSAQLLRPVAKKETADALRTSEPGTPPRPEDEPLRIRPVGALHLEDFKMNPAWTELAFADTLRGRDQRRNFQPCTKADCCGGAFRKAINMGGTSLSGKTDAQALYAYLGPTWADIMGATDPAKRQDIIINAHVQAFAEANGKHRHAFERRSTPPGFWRTDMPTTQEASMDRAKATDMEAEAINFRWREALKPDGRWRFRDE